MKTFIRTLCILSAFTLALISSANAQTGVFNPDDPIVVYKSTAPPATPPYGTVAKWVKTNRVSFNTTSFKAYYYKGMAFRLKFPKTYKDSINTGKKYPIFVFFHGIGEKGTVYDNEYQLYHGGQKWISNVDNGSFDGFLLYPQSSSGSGAFNTNHFQLINELITQFLVPENKVDINRVIIDGLSGGGGATWQMLRNYPNLVAAGVPISAVSVADGASDMTSMLKWTPIWLHQGYLDKAPHFNTARNVVANYKAAGANITYTEYPTLGHSCWNQAWADPNFVPFIVKAHKANPWASGGRVEFCPSDVISAQLGVTGGFDGYEWSKDGVTIPGAVSNTYTATEIGTYACRIRRDTSWSVWSPIPVVIKYKGTTISPDITTTGLISPVIPSPDGNTSVALEVPDGYATYLWQKDGSTTTLSTTRFFNATEAGNYRVKVTEEFGCSSEFSNPFLVVNANAANGPSPASGLVATTLSKTAIKLDWLQNPSPAFNETGFEIYRAPAATGPFALLTKTAADVVTYTDQDLTSNTQFFYKVRAVNNNAGSAATDAVSAKTQADVTAPLAPGDLRVSSSTRNSVTLVWDEASDDVGVVKYDIFVNGTKYYETDLTEFTVFNLAHGTTYNFRVQARDFAGNKSPMSNQVTAQPVLDGLMYKYYTYTGTWTALPDFNTLDPDATGVVPNITIANRSQDDRYAYLWEGFITIPSNGTYYFRTTSKDGSRLWLGSLGQSTSAYAFGATSLVNNDGTHGSKTVTSNGTYLQAGTYPIAIGYYEGTGTGQAISISWRTPSSGTSYVTIPNSAFADPVDIQGSAPNAPSALTAQTVSYKRIDLGWTDNSSDENGFEIWRSTNPVDSFTIIGNTAAGITTFIDSVGLAPATTYFYQVGAIGQYGESALTPAINSTDAQANWRLNNNYTDNSGNGRTITGSSSPVFNANDKKEGSHALSFNGSSQYIDVSTASGDYIRGGYNVKSISFWMKSTNNTGDRFLFDFGGSDNGIAMRLNSNTLYAGVASSNNRKNISVPYTSSDWNFVTLVYNVNTLTLYMNGVQVATNAALGFNSIGSTSNASRIAYMNSSNAFNTGNARFAGLLDNFAVFSKALTVTEIQQLMANTYKTVNAKTLDLPAVPATPTNLLASGVSTSGIAINWNDNSSTEQGYELYRSAQGNSNYVLLASLPANTTSYADTALYANTTFYYKLRALNEGGYSEYSNEDSAATFNNIPVLTAITEQYVRFGTQLQLPVVSSDIDPETLTVNVTNLPAFASFVPSGNGTGTITFNPSFTDLGTYSNVTVTVTDEHNGVATTSFNVIVDQNYRPLIAPVTGVSVKEKETATINLTASDDNAADNLTWTFTGLPGFITPAVDGRSASLSIAPGYADNGVYAVKVKIDDANGGVDTTTLNVTVEDVNPSKTVYVAFGDATIAAPAPWNKTAKVPAANDNFPNLKDELGATTSVGLLFNTAWGGANNGGVNTGNNSGVYPDAVLRSSYFTNATRTFKVYGLNPAVKYDLTMLASRANPTVGVAGNYTVAGQTITMDAANNSQNTAAFHNVTPAADSSITVSVVNASGSSYAYINALVVRSLYDDSTAPAKPRNLHADNLPNKVRLTWIDAAYNETSYEVYKATNIAGPYTLLTPGGNNANLVQYDDNSIGGNVTYYYTVRALNSYGSSPYSDTVSITTPNVAPVLNTISNVIMATQQTVNVNVTATDPGDVVTLNVANLPAFATFADNGNGTGSIQITSGIGTGTFNNIVVSATDSHGAITSQTFSITVTIANLTRVLVNFNQTFPVAAPWNSTNAAPTANLTLTNMKDETNTASGINLTLLDAWTTHQTNGVVTGNNSGIFPDDVMRTYYYYSGAETRRVKLSGLDAGKKYDLSFFASRANSATALVTRYTVGAQSVDLNANNNSSQTVKIQGLVPDANGEIIFTAQKVNGTANTYLGALVIEAYPNNGTPATPPANVTATGLDPDKIQVKWGNVVNTTTYEIWRSSAANGTYTKVGEVPTGTFTYTNTGLAANTVYYYKVRAVVNGTPGSFSNYAGASTVAYTIQLNMNDGSVNAPAQTTGNWNNLNALISDGFVLSNMINTLGLNTGINWSVVKTFSGFNYYGAVTGNNSGIYPDNVIKSFYYSSYADTAKLRITGLTLGHVYNFSFFGSRVNPQVSVVGAYKIGNTTVTLDAANNTQNTVQISGVVPDASGAVDITIFSMQQGAIAYLNAMTIEGAPAVAPDPALGGMTARGSVGTVETGTTAVATDVAAKKTVVDNTPAVTVDVFPNPFRDDVTLKLDIKENTGKFSVVVSDLSGKIVHRLEVANAVKGIRLQKLGLRGASLPQGIYLVRVVGLAGEGSAPMKIIKE